MLVAGDKCGCSSELIQCFDTLPEKFTIISINAKIVWTTKRSLIAI